MDHHHLPEMGEEVQRERSGRSDPSVRPPSATNNLRRTSTEREGRPSLSTADDMNDDSYNFPTGPSYSWGSQSDSEDRPGSASRSSSRRDRKFDMTTPTLVDEDEGCLDEEEEMISLQRTSLHQGKEGFMLRGDESSLRRTPGASMYKSSFHEEQMRRTPGAGEMHRSAAPAASLSHEQADESAVLGFGLTLSTPVATGNISMKKQGETWEDQSTSSSATPPRTNQTTEALTLGQTQDTNRPPRAPVGGGRPATQQQPQISQRGEFTFTPWTLPRGAQFENRQGSCSPNTLRLTEDLGNLLLEEEDSTDHGSQQIYGGFMGKTAHDFQQTSAENWTAPYIFKAEQTGDIPSRVPRSSVGRGRKGKNDSSRRSRAYDRSGKVSEEQRQQVASFLPYAQQPKPVRSMQTSSVGNNPFLSGSGPIDTSNTGTQTSSDHSEQPQPKFFNFGGAFAPPAKDSSVSFTPVSAPPASSEQSNRSTSFTAPQPHYQPHYQQHYQQQSLQPGPSSAFGGSGAFSGGFHTQSFQPLPPVADPSRDSPFQHPFPASNPSYDTVSASPALGYSSASPYLPQPSAPAQTSASYQPHGAGAAPSPYPSFASNSAASPYSQPTVAANPYPQQHMIPSSASFYAAHRSSPHLHTNMQADAHEFIPMASSPHHQLQRSSIPQVHQRPQEWPGVTPVEFSGSFDEANWPGAGHGWMASGEFIYGAPNGPPQQIHGIPPAPLHMSPLWPDHGMSPGLEYPSQHSPNMFGVAPRMEGPHHLVPVAAPTPVFPIQGSLDHQQAPQQRPKGKKGHSKRLSKPGKPEKGKKSDSGPSNAASIQQRKSTPVNAGGIIKGKKKSSSKGRDSQTSELTAGGTASVCSTPSNVPTPANVPGGDEGGLSASEDPADAKRSELIESPATRSAFKDFYRKFRSEERSSFQGAEDYAIQSLADGSLPEKVHWRVYLELADLAKRSNRFADARRLYQRVCQLQPYASQGWLEYSKLEEECGHLNRGARILRTGLEYCEYSENLLTRAIKHEEKMGNLSRARELLARLKHVGIEKVWRTVLEGALLEARAGNVVMARRVLKYLMHHVPWYGPLYLEAYRLERDLGRTAEALEVVERGLEAIPRYGPLWFGAFRLCEEIDRAEDDFCLSRTMAMIDRATECISKELIWKVHLDAAQMLERAAVDLRDSVDDFREEHEEKFQSSLASCRHRFAMTIFNCPQNLRWKVWLAAGRMEISVGNIERARLLFLRAHQVVPEKGRATTLLECARLEEFAGDPELANAILCKSRVDYGSDWKVWLESVILEIRLDNHGKAIELAKGALEIHPGTGRLWASLVQLRFFEGGEEGQFLTLKQALNAVPKSGEVWCEGGRIHLNPFSRTFNLDRARRHLFFATKFTPQYGDSFLETLRLELLEQWFVPIATLIWESTKGQIIGCDMSEFHGQLAEYIDNVISELLILCGSEGMSAGSEADTGLTGIIDDDIAAQIRERLESSYRESLVDLSELELRCANADPNYGSLWFHCRTGPTDTARRILSRATDKVVTELRKFVHIYVGAMIRYFAIMSSIAVGKEAEVDEGKDALPSLDDAAAWDDYIDKKLLAAPSLTNIYMEKNNRGEGMMFLENTMTTSMFATGLAELNKHQPTGEMSLNERRKALFGTDALFS